MADRAHPTDAGALDFFVDVTNLAQPTDAHMHNMSFTFLDRDHFIQEWILSRGWKGGAASV